MTPYEHIKVLGLTGTNEEKVAQYNAIGFTNTKIRLDDLLFLMSDRWMLVRLLAPDPDGIKWEGTVVNLIKYVNQVGTDDQKRAVNKFFSHITNDRNTYFDTTLLEYAASFAQIVALFGGAPTMPSIDDFNAVYVLGGGKKSITIEQFNAAIAAEEAANAEAEAQEARRAFMAEFYYPAFNANVAPVLDGASPLTQESVASALEAMASQIRSV